MQRLTILHDLRAHGLSEVRGVALATFSWNAAVWRLADRHLLPELQAAIFDTTMMAMDRPDLAAA